MDRENLQLSKQLLSDIAAAALDDQLVTQTEATQLVGVHRGTISYHIKQGHLSRHIRGLVLWSEVRRLFAPEVRGKWRAKWVDRKPVAHMRVPQTRERSQVEQADVMSGDWLKK